MLVHGMFNASVARGKRLKKVAIGSAVTFAVTSLYEARGMLSLEGDLISVASPEKEEE